MKRYAVFIFAQYYPIGGMKDYKASFDSVEAAKDYVKTHEDTCDSWNDSEPFSRWHIYDMQEMKILADQKYSDDWERQNREDDEAFAAQFLEFQNRG